MKRSAPKPDRTDEKVKWLEFPKPAAGVAATFGEVVACILTYNRKETLLVCLEAILAQSHRVDRVIIYDNASTDGTFETLRETGLLRDERIEFIRAERNTGPAGGFSAVLQRGYATGAAWLWAMDDDVIPEPDALEELVSAYRSSFSDPSELGFLVSRVRTPDGEPNNVPDVDDRQDHRSAPKWTQLLQHAMVRVKWSTLNSILIPRETFRDFGFPSADFVYGGEDIELTLRIARERPCYIAGRSLATHLRASSGTFHPLNEANPARIPLFFYYYRNQTYLRRSLMGRRALMLFSLNTLKDIVRVACSGPRGPATGRIITRGAVAGFFFRPRRIRAAPP